MIGRMQEDFMEPKGFELVWEQARGGLVRIWRVCPPSDDYVALGDVATTTIEPPQRIDGLVCVPRNWVMSWDEVVRDGKIWDDAGTGGADGSFWQAPAQGLFLVSGPGRPGVETGGRFRRPEGTFGRLLPDADRPLLSQPQERPDLEAKDPSVLLENMILHLMRSLDEHRLAVALRQIEESEATHVDFFSECLALARRDDVAVAIVAAQQEVGTFDTGLGTTIAQLKEQAAALLDVPASRLALAGEGKQLQDQKSRICDHMLPQADGGLTLVVSHLTVLYEPRAPWVHIWTLGCSARNGPISIWRPTLKEGEVYFGDCVVRGTEQPGTGALVCVGQPQGCFPAPIGFEYQWEQARGGLVVVWRPMPPSDGFVALGHIATTSQDPPTPAMLPDLRCVPRDMASRWSVFAEGSKIWSDESTGGADGAFWQAPTPGLFVVNGQSHQPPAGEYPFVAPSA